MKTRELIEDRINKIHTADCMDFMKEMPDKCVDIIVTSPPYNANMRLGDGVFREIKDKSDKRTKYDGFNDAMQPLEYFEWQKNLLEQMLRITKHQVFYNIQVLSSNKLAVFKLFGYFATRIKEVIIWDKGYGEPAIQEGVMNSVWEYIIVFDDGDAQKRRFENAPFDRGTMNNIIRIGKNSENKFSESNSACFPLKIAELLVQFAPTNGIVLDPFNGSGTTCLAAKNSGRKYIGIDISTELNEIAQQRLQQQLLFV